MEAARRVGVQLHEACVQRRGTLGLRHGLVAAADVRIMGQGCVHGGAEQRVVVEGGSSDKEGDPPAHVDAANGIHRALDERGHGKVDVGVRDVDHVVRNLAPNGGGHFVRAHVHIAVDLT